MLLLKNSFELYKFLYDKNLLENSPKYWWPNPFSFEVVISAILTQNTKWENVEKSLSNLKQNDLLFLEKLSQTNEDRLSLLIKPSGFQNQKSARLIKLSTNIIKDFTDFKKFQDKVSRDWLLSQTGIGNESADAILCYACAQEEMVVDKYTQKLVSSFGYDFKTYEDLKLWLECGINENFDKILQLYNYNISLNEVYCRFHGKIVEYMKKVK